jgi:hypothetical protein
LPATKKTFDGADKITDLSKSIGLHGMDLSKLKLIELLLGNGDNLNYTDYYNFILAPGATGGNTMHEWQYFYRAICILLFISSTLKFTFVFKAPKNFKIVSIVNSCPEYK